MLTNSAIVVGGCSLLDEYKCRSHHQGLKPTSNPRGHKREKSTDDGRLQVDVKKFRCEVLEVETGFVDEGALHHNPKKLTIRAIEAEAFRPHDLLPVAQLDESWCCQLSTTLAVVTSSPHQVGNDILHFLRSVAASSVKLRCTKGTIKATLVHDLTLVSLKFRLLVLVTGIVAVQVQRRAGDSVAFSQVFASFTNHLQALHYEFQSPALCDESLFPFVLPYF